MHALDVQGSRRQGVAGVETGRGIVSSLLVGHSRKVFSAEAFGGSRSPRSHFNMQALKAADPAAMGGCWWVGCWLTLLHATPRVDTKNSCARLFIFRIFCSTLNCNWTLKGTAMRHGSQSGIPDTAVRATLLRICLWSRRSRRASSCVCVAPSAAVEARNIFQTQ
jgi:hypothetical protein